MWVRGWGAAHVSWYKHLENRGTYACTFGELLRPLAVCMFHCCLCCWGWEDCRVSITALYSPLRRHHGHSQPAQESCRLCSLNLENYLTKDHGLPGAAENKDCKGFEFLGRSLNHSKFGPQFALCAFIHAVKFSVSIYPWEVQTSPEICPSTKLEDFSYIKQITLLNTSPFFFTFLHI